MVPKKSTAARKDVHTVGDQIGGAAESGERKPQNALPVGIAGTQALPVDTKPKFDRTAYQRDYMRKRRAKQKALD